MEIATTALIAPLARTSVAPPQEAVPGLPATAPNELAAARFAAIMAAPDVAETAPTKNVVASLEPGVGAATSLGDRMLASLQGASDDFKGLWRTTESQINSEQNMGVREMLSIQMQVTQISVGFEFLGKAVSRSTQNLDQLVRIQ